ncbi:glycosyl transferase family 1 [Duncaniella muris]|uniref:Glycosyl transferase family 1 n=2 Tax=Bacteria TaxID=2 RepID=A0A2V1IJW7_9BACT|nr:glycosyltransferase [Duncaniella muris]NBH93406.1 glycosyltransferase [Muribaculaceae bacterium S4]NBI21708.1 glycosyltransferase [Muribaculaceae bacterium Z1]PWB02496.1 glycosyl transferase family 1 [Duncaniella muris]GFI53120.1 GDP-mannose-dependent alpha-(1-6)-phosphatidylinositol monomannoside mannosyltransferase [Muribaculaceae bacterium]
MHIIHSGHLNVHSGGPALSTWLTIKGLREKGVDTDIVMPPIDPGDQLIDKAAKPIYYRQPKYGTLAYVPKYDETVKSIGDADLYHVQGVWMLHGTQLARYAMKHRKPYVVTLRGMFYPQALAHKRLLKMIMRRLYQDHTLCNAAAVQATCIEEMEHYRALGFKNPVAVIPNPIETEGLIDRPIPEKPQFRIGYLGRVHPRKRIERLIYAMADLREKLPDDAELLIIGGGDNSYEKFLHDEVCRLNLSNVKFAGFLTGKEKDAAIDSLSILVVPSDYENFGNIVTEALVHGVPVIASTGMPWQELPKHNCGWWISNDQNSINQTILSAYMLGENKLKTMGENGRELIRRNYSVEALGTKMKNLYEWILGIAPKPEFVFI